MSRAAQGRLGKRARTSTYGEYRGPMKSLLTQ